MLPAGIAFLHVWLWLCNWVLCQRLKKKCSDLLAFPYLFPVREQLSASCESLQKFCCDTMSEIQISRSLGKRILRWQVCLDSFRRDHKIKIFLPLKVYCSSTSTLLSFPRCKATCTHCLETIMPRLRAESIDLCRNTSYHVVIRYGKNTPIVTVRTSHTRFNIVGFTGRSGWERCCQIFRKQNLIFLLVLFLSQIFLQLPEPNGSLRVLFQTGFPVPIANGVVALEVRPTGDTGNAMRALTAI